MWSFWPVHDKTRGVAPPAPPEAETERQHWPLPTAPSFQLSALDTLLLQH